MLTLSELKEKIVQQVDEVDLLDMLALTTQDLVDAFEDKIEDRYETFLAELE